MPYCRNCPNNRYFGSSKIPSVAPTANGPLSGICADFAAGEAMLSITYQGNDKKALKMAINTPRDYFDICLKCGGENIDWHNSTIIEQ